MTQSSTQTAILPRKTKSAWPVITTLLLVGAVPSLPGLFIIFLLVQGPALDGTINDFVRAHYVPIPAPIVLHIVFGTLFSALAPFQFSQGIRNRWPTWHRWSGRTVFVSGIILGLSAMWMVLYFPPSGGVIMSFGLFISGAAVIASLLLALRAILSGRVPVHRAWMMRTVAIMFGALTPILFQIPLFFILEEFPDFISEWERLFGMALNLLFVEWLLRRRPTQKSGLMTKTKETV